MKAISYDFCDWVIKRINANLEGQLPEELVIDERKGNLRQNLMKAVNKGIGACVVVGVGEITPQGGFADDTQCEVTVNIAVFHNSNMRSAFDSRLFAENLYRKFAGAEYEQPPVLRANVKAGHFETQGEDKKMHIFNVSFLKTLKGV